MSILVTLAWRNLWLHKLRTILTIVSIVLGVAVILAVRTANRSTLNSVEALFNEAAGKASLTVESAVSSRRAQIGFPQDVVQQVQAMPGVVQAVPRLVAQTVYLQGKKGQVELAVQGIDPAVDDQVRAYSLVEGDFLSTTDRGYTAMLVDDFAQREGIRVGQDIELLAPNGPEVFRVVGIMARKNAGLMNGGQVVFVPLKVGQDVFRRGRKIDAVDVVAEPAIVQSPASLRQLNDQIQTALGDAYTVGYPAAKGLQVTEALASVQYGLGFFGLFALFASALLIYTTFTMELAERIREIGSLRTLGLSRTQIVGQLFGNALLLGLIGSGLGLGLGFVLAVPLLQFFASWTGYQVLSLSPSVTDIVQSFLAGSGYDCHLSLVAGDPGLPPLAAGGGARTRPRAGRPVVTLELAHRSGAVGILGRVLLSPVDTQHTDVHRPLWWSHIPAAGHRESDWQAAASPGGDRIRLRG